MMPLRAAIQSIVFVASVALCPLVSRAQTNRAQDDLTKPFDWPTIGSSSEAGIQLFLRTRWQGGSLQYIVTLTDRKGRIAKWFLKHPDNGPVPHSSFQVTFDDEEKFHLYTLYLSDRTFMKGEDKESWESKGERQCSEKIYRGSLKAANATSKSDQSSHGLNYPIELDAPSSPTRKR